MKPRNLIAKLVTVVLFSMLILSFAIWGIGDIFRGGGQTQAVAEVGDTVVQQRDFARELSNEMNTMSRRLGVQLTMEQARAFGIAQQVLERMITRAMLDELSQRLGLLVTEEQMRQRLLESPEFQDSAGRFDRNRFAQMLQFSNMTEQGFLARLGDDIKRQQLVAAVTDAAVAPRSLAQQLFTYREERRVADYVTVANSAFEVTGAPDEAALQALYDSAGEAVMTPAYRDIALVVLSVADAARGIAVSDERIAEAFEQRKDELSTPERRTVSQVVLPDQATAEAVAARIAEGADFVAAAEEASGRAPVALGSVTRDDLPAELGEPVFALEAGQTTAPVQSSFGWHIAKVEAIEPGKEVTLEETRDQLRRELAEEEAIEVVIDLANQFDEKLAGGSTMEQAAQSLNLTVRDVPAIDAQGRAPDGTLVEGLPAINEFLPLLNATRVGETTTLTETMDGDYFILRVDGETPAEKKPLAEVRDQLVEQWRQRERERLAEEKAEALTARLRGGETLAAVAAAEGLEAKQTEPVTRFETAPQRVPSPLVAQQIFEIAEGEVTTVVTGEGRIVAQLKEILPPLEENREARLDRLEEQLTTGVQNDIFQQFLNALQADFDVTINQRLVQETLANF